MAECLPGPGTKASMSFGAKIPGSESQQPRRKQNKGNPQASSSDDDASSAAQTTSSTVSPWQAVVDAVVPAIVALQVSASRSFQDDLAGAHGGTGFVVDAERGLLLTNRHVCTSGPARATATFVGCSSMEEVPVHVSYVDPAHDFAFLRFDPRELRQTPRAEIRLDPDGCKVGAEVRIIGNDSLEKLQILSGTIARIDRDAPELAGDFQDENTFYALAASGTRGGSSGSPVINARGRAVALNAAAASGTMHGFYLPLHRVVRALELLRAGLLVPRGTICAQLHYAPFPECCRLGVSKEFLQNQIVNSTPPAGGTFSKSQPPGGMLRVWRCLPETPAAQALRPGDVLLELNGQPCVDFVLFDATLDASVGQQVSLVVCRGGERLEVSLEVRDLAALQPHGFVELGMGIFHDVPYQTAQKHNVPLRGVYVAQAGFAFGESVKSDAVIRSINGTACENLRSFEEAIQQIKDREYFSVSWMQPKRVRERTCTETFVKMRRQWFAYKAWSLESCTRRWIPRHLEAPGAAVSAPHAASDATADAEPSGVATSAASTSAGPKAGAKAGAKAPAGGAKAPAAKRRKKATDGALGALEQVMCSVSFRTIQNLSVDLVVGTSGWERDVYESVGAGVVVDAALGLILTDRTTVPQTIGDIEVSLGETQKSASVWFMHPNHSLVLLKLDPPLAGENAAFGKNATFVDRVVQLDEEFDFVGIDDDGKRHASTVTVRSVGLSSFPRHWPPVWHERNVEAIKLTEDPSNINAGVLCNKSGEIYAIYVLAPSIDDGESDHNGYALPSALVLPLIEHIRTHGVSASPSVPSLEIELHNLQLAKLRRLPARLRPAGTWLERLAAASTQDESAEVWEGCVLQVAGITAGGPCHGLVAEGDLLVAIGGNVVTTARAVEDSLAEAAKAAITQTSGPSSHPTAEVTLTLMRSGQTRDVVIRAPFLESDGARRMLCWNGMMLTETPRPVRECGLVPPGLHIADMQLGSPAEAASLEGQTLVSVNGTPTPTLDALLTLDLQQRRSAKQQHDSSTTRSNRCHHLVETAKLNGRRYVQTLEPDLLFWPTTKIFQNSSGAWSCTELTAS